MSRVCMLAHSYFPHNSRTRVQALALAEAGHDVEVICPRGPGEPQSEEYSGVRISRLRVSRDRSRGKLAYLAEYATFFALASRALSKRERAEHFDLIVVHNIPEELVFATWPSKRRGASVMLDVHDPLPELFADKYGLRDGSRVKRLLERLELASCRYADHVLVANGPMEPRLISMGYPAERITQILNCPLSGGREEGETEPFVVVYHGSLFERYGMETVLRGFARAAEEVPSVELHLYGSDVDGRYVEHLKGIAQQLGIEKRVAFNGFAAPIALRRILAHADLGVSPMRRSCHIDLVYPTKLLEYLAHGVPVLSVRTPALEALFSNGEVYFYDNEDAEDFADALVRIVRATPERRGAPARENNLPSELSWSEMWPRYSSLVDSLSAVRSPAAGKVALDSEEQ